jgi:arylformamidase
MTGARTALWRGYDKAALDAQLSLASVHGLEAIFARRQEAARRARADLLHRSGIAYGDGASERFDFFPVIGARDAPVLVYIHGGFWRSLDAALFSFVARGFVTHGIACAILDYPLIPTVRLADILASCRRAIAWIHDHAEELGIARERVFVAGNSAGGHLTALLADRAWPSAHGLPADVVKGACAVSGLFELEPVRLSDQNDTLALTPEEVAALSPLRHVPRAAAPTIFAVGGDETQEFLDQNREGDAAWRRAGLACEHIEVAGTNHITVVLDALADPANKLNRALRAMIGVA